MSILYPMLPEHLTVWRRTYLNQVPFGKIDPENENLYEHLVAAQIEDFSSSYHNEGFVFVWVLRKTIALNLSSLTAFP
jgi:hypothetical protein